MKKIFITAAIATMFSITAFADGGKKATTVIGDENVTYTVLNQFKYDFKDAENVVWTVTSSCQKATFVEGDISYTAFYSTYGDYLGLAHNVEVKSLSNTVKAKIAEEYKGYNVVNIIKYETQQGDQLMYSVRIKVAGADKIIKATADAPVVYFVDLKSATDEVMVKVTADNSLVPFKS